MMKNILQGMLILLFTGILVSYTNDSEEERRQPKKEYTRNLFQSEFSGKYLPETCNLCYSCTSRLATMCSPISKKTLRLVSQNIWGKSTKDAVDHFYKLDADVMCMQECNHIIAEEVEAYGLYIHSHNNNTQGRCSIISKYPFEGTTPNKFGVYIHLGDSIKILVMNCHGAYKPYGPYQLNGINYGGFRATNDVNGVIEANKNARKDMVEALLEDFRSATTQFVSISGDFNEPSWLDWTTATTQAGLSTYVVQWPTTYALWKGGVKGDAYRTIHPDPVAHPGFTWSSKPGARDTKDRIDLTLYNINEHTSVKSCKVVGESDDTSDIVILPWIFDHRGLCTEFVYEQ